jgi:hypothetical protein
MNVVKRGIVVALVFAGSGLLGGCVTVGYDLLKQQVTISTVGQK